MIAVAAISLAIWVHILFFRGGFWKLRVREVRAASSGARVIAVMPARNEAEHVGQAIASLLRQEGVELSVVLVDDASSDGTAAVARIAAQTIGAGERLTLISGAPLAQGWTGKLWALQQGIERAITDRPDFILLTDADIEHGPSVVASLVSRAGEGFDLVSRMVMLHCESTAERLLIPAFVYFFFQLYPPAWIADPRSKTAGAAGGCMLIRPESLASAGGIEAIRGEIIDDCALAKAVKRNGGRVSLDATESSRSLRGYATFAEIGRMIARTAFNQLRHSFWLLLVAVAGLLLTHVAPIVAVASAQKIAMMLGGAAWAAMTVSYLPTVRLYRLNPLWALSLPVASLFFLGATVWSAMRHWSGKGGEWKGRAQDYSTR